MPRRYRRSATVLLPSPPENTRPTEGELDDANFHHEELRRTLNCVGYYERDDGTYDWVTREAVDAKLAKQVKHADTMWDVACARSNEIEIRHRKWEWDFTHALARNFDCHVDELVARGMIEVDDDDDDDDDDDQASEEERPRKRARLDGSPSPPPIEVENKSNHSSSPPPPPVASLPMSNVPATLVNLPEELAARPELVERLAKLPPALLNRLDMAKNENLSLSNETKAQMTVIRNTISDASYKIVAAAVEAGKYDVGRVIAAVDQLQQAKDIACAALTIPYGPAK